MKDSYRNPFSGVNAVQLDADLILEYWCNPFLYDLFSGIKEDDIYNDSNNIVLMGGRSTGKSMFLRYWSYQIQHKLSDKEGITLFEMIKRNNGVGFYFRIDGAKLKSFQGLGLSNEHWTSVFTHYFELIVGRQYIELLNILFSTEKKLESFAEGLIPKLCDFLDFNKKYSTFQMIIEEFDRRIREVEVYLGNVPFYKEEFLPCKRGYLSQSLSFGIPELLSTVIPEFKNLNIIILLDEYENFLEYQQKTINTLLRFTKPHLKFRIGMRLEGFRTFEMISEDDFIKEGREYRKVVFEEILNKDKGYQDFLYEISKKRLESIQPLKEKGFIDIKKILGDRENLEEEALELVSSKPDKIINHFAKKFNSKSLNRLRYPSNPLLELQNCIWLLRGVPVETIIKSMNDYLENKKKSPDGIKYRRDYIDKYKLSLTFLLCSIYRKNKQYYSFNTFAFLSSGIVGHFIELCRRSFAIADWGDTEKLFAEGVISKEFQNKAAIEFSNSEKQQIGRIETFGGKISQLVENLGNIFRGFHLDYQLRYPETNQFAINIDSIQDEDIKDAIKAAIRWTVVQRKPKMQRSAPNESLRDTYTINRIYSPNFQISYRTRGGKSIMLGQNSLKRLMNEDRIKIGDFLAESDLKFDDDSFGDMKNLFSEL